MPGLADLIATETESFNVSVVVDTNFFIYLGIKHFIIAHATIMHHSLCDFRSSIFAYISVSTVVSLCEELVTLLWESDKRALFW